MAAARVLNSAMRTIVERGGESAQVFFAGQAGGGRLCRVARLFRIAEEFIDPGNFVFPFAIPLTDHGPSGGGDALPQRVIGETLFDGFSEAGCGSVTQQAVLAIAEEPLGPVVAVGDDQRA